MQIYCIFVVSFVLYLLCCVWICYQEERRRKRSHMDLQAHKSTFNTLNQLLFEVTGRFRNFFCYTAYMTVLNVGWWIVVYVWIICWHTLVLLPIDPYQRIWLWLYDVWDGQYLGSLLLCISRTKLVFTLYSCPGQHYFPSSQIRCLSTPHVVLASVSLVITPLFIFVSLAAALQHAGMGLRPSYTH